MPRKPKKQPIPSLDGVPIEPVSLPEILPIPPEITKSRERQALNADKFDGRELEKPEEPRDSHIERARFMKPPSGWIPAWSSSKHGIQVLKRIDDHFKTTAIQFDKEPLRAVKDDAEIAGLRYDPRKAGQQTWEITGIPPKDTVAIAKGIAEKHLGYEPERER